MGRRIWTATYLACVTVTICGCEAVDDIRSALDEPIVQDALRMTVAGVSPAPDFRQTGNLNFDLVRQGASGELAQLGRQNMHVEVENDDGTYSDCERTGGTTVKPSPYQALTLLLDGSGSMELAYPPDEYDDACVTCPHDPDRERVYAGSELVSTIAAASPRSLMAIAEFGPGPSPGFSATWLHSDFINDVGELEAALDQVQGYERVGTPLYDSLAEMIDETFAASQALEASLGEAGGGDVARYVVVLSDGEDNASTAWNVDSVVEWALEADVAVYAVGLGPASAANADPDFVDPVQTQAVRNLQRLASETGGFYAAATNPHALGSLYDNLGRALTEGYQTETYSCIPRPTDDTPKEECDVPPVGSRIDGRISYGDVQVPWVTVAN